MDKEDVRRRRDALGMTQEQLAARLGVTRQSVYSWERGTFMPAGRLLELALRALAQEQEQARSEEEAAS